MEIKKREIPLASLIDISFLSYKPICILCKALVEDLLSNFCLNAKIPQINHCIVMFLYSELKLKNLTPVRPQEH